MTMEQLKQYNGLGPEGRVLVAVNGKIFDVTKGMYMIIMILSSYNLPPYFLSSIATSVS